MRRPGRGTSRAGASVRLRREGAGSAASGEIEGQRPLALHQPVRDIFGHRVDQSGDTLALADGDAAVARVLQEPIDAAVAPHLDEADMVDEEARALAMGEADVEEIAILRHLGEHRGEMVAQNFEPGDLGFAQIGEHVGALRIGEASAPQRAGEVGDARLLIVRRGLGARGGGACARNAPLGDRRRSGVSPIAARRPRGSDSSSSLIRTEGCMAHPGHYSLSRAAGDWKAAPQDKRRKSAGRAQDRQ